MTREQAEQYVHWRIDTALSPDSSAPLDKCALIGWQCGFEPAFVAVYDYIRDGRPDEEEAVEIAMDYLMEIGWLARIADGPDYIL